MSPRRLSFSQSFHRHSPAVKGADGCR
jgi:hypothetical protein